MAGYSVTFSVVDNATRQIDLINRRITQMRAPMERMGRSFAKFLDVSGLRRVADGFGWVARAAEFALRSMLQIVPVLGTITGAATIAGMIKLVSSFASWGATLAIDADRLGLTADTLQKFQDAARLAGGSAEDMTAALQALVASSRDALLKGGETAAAFNQLGISIKDSNGNLRSAADLLPEVIDKISKMKDPADRARFAQLLLGGAGEKLVATFRTSGKTLQEWLDQAAQLPQATEKQRQALLGFAAAQNSLGVTFDHLGQQIAAVIAEHFVPLMQRLDEFVQKHTPEIVAAIDQIAQRFADWLSNVDWSKVQDGANSLLQSLKWVVNNLDTIKDAAEVIAGIFIAKWGIQAVAGVTALLNAIGTAGGGFAAAGTGLLGALAGVAAIAAALAAVWFGNKGGQKEIENQAKGMGFEQVPGGPFGMPTFRNPQTGETMSYDEMLEKQGRPHGGGGFIEDYLKRMWQGARGNAAPSSAPGPASPAAPGAIQPAAFLVPAPSNMNLPQQNLERGASIRDRLAADLQLTPEQASGIVGNLQAESGLQAVQERNPIGGGRGGYGWAQWTGPRRVAFEKYAAEHGLDVKSDEANYGFLRQELQSPEYANTLRNLREQKTAEGAAASFERDFERPAVSNAGVRGMHARKFASATAPPVAQGPAANTNIAGGAPANGAVQVTVTHKNPPAGATVEASGTGNGVNVDPPRTERQALLASI